MADRRVTFLIGANIQNFQKNLNKAQRKFRSFGRKLERTGQTLTRNLTVPVAAIGGLALKAAADFETLQVQLNTLTGSAEAGAKAFKNLRDFSAQTPFQLKDLAKANNTLLGFGLNAEDAFKHLKTLGDVAAVSGGDLQAISVAFGQAAAEGRLMTRDVRQLINQGVPAIKLLADSMGVAQSEVLDLASAGEITFPKLVKAMEDATRAGGMFEGGTRKLSQTLSGLFSTLRDNVNIALGELGKTIDETFNIKGAIKNVTDGIRNAVEAFQSLSPRVKKMALTIAALIGAGGPILVALGTLSAAIGAISLPITATVAAVGVGVGLMIKHWDKIVDYFNSGAGSQVWESLKDTAQGTFKVLKDLFTTVVSALERIWGLFGEEVIGILTGAFKIVKGNLQLALNSLMTVLDIFTLRWITDWQGFLDDTKERFANVFGKGGALSTIFDGFVTAFLTRAGQMDNLFGGLVIDENGIRWVSKSAEAIKEQGRQALWTKDALDDYAASVSGLFDNVGKTPNPTPTANPKPMGGSGGGQSGFGRYYGEDMFKGWLPQLEAVKRGFNKLRISVSDTKSAVIGNIAAMGASGQHLDPIKVALGEFDKKLGITKKKMIEMSQVLEQTLNSAVVGFAETMGNAFTGDAGASGFFNNILMVVLDFTKQFGKLLVSAGIAALSFKKLLLNPVAAIAAGTALIVASTAIRNLLKDGPGGKQTSVNDALIRSDGSIVKFHPDDNILAMKDFSKVGMGSAPTGNGMSMSMLQRAFEGALSNSSLKARGNDLVLVTNNANSSILR